MGCFSIFNNTISQIIHQQSQLVSTIAINTVCEITKIFIYCLSPKQIIRPDSYSEMCFNIFPKISSVLLLKFWKLKTIFKELIPYNEGAFYIESLTIIKKLSEDNKIDLLPKEKVMLNGIFDLALKHKNYLDRFNFFIISQENKLTSVHNDCKKLLLMHDDVFFNQFYAKIERLSKLNINDEIEPIEEHEKLDRKDALLLHSASAMKSLAESLYQNGINGMKILVSKWSKIEMINESNFFNELKKLCVKSCAPGNIFLGDRYTVDVLTGRQSDVIDVLQQIFMGRICHVGIFVQPEEKGLNISHVNGITNNHAIKPIRFPFNIPFSYTLELDISSLIPKEVSQEHYPVLTKSFSKAFQKFAEELHPELPLADTKAHLNMFIFGHKKIFGECLEKVRLPSKGTPTMCSSYVGIIFLKAIHEVNLTLKNLNYKNEIPHPFGEHENLMNLDILRLVYLWNQLKIIREPQVHPTISKVMTSLSTIKLNKTGSSRK